MADKDHEGRLDALWLEEFVGYNLKRAYIVLQADFRRALGPDLAPRVFSALLLVVQSPNVTQSELARHLGIERSGLVAIIDELEERGLVQRKPVPSDRRVQALVPTELGQSVAEHALEAARAHEAAFLSDFSVEEKATLMRLLQKIRTRKV